MVRDGTRNRWGSSRRVWGPMSRFGTGRGTLRDVLEGSGDLITGTGQVMGHSGVQDESQDPLGGPRWVGGPS